MKVKGLKFLFVTFFGSILFFSCLFNTSSSPKVTPKKYKVIYMLQNLNQDEYFECGFDVLEGSAGEMTEAVPRNFDGFTPQLPVTQQEISPSNSTVVRIYYERNLVDITFYANGGAFTENNSDVLSKSFKYGEMISAPQTVRDGYAVKWPEFPRAGSNAATSYTAEWISTNLPLKDKYFYLVEARDENGASVLSKFSSSDRTFIYIFSGDHTFESGTVRAEDNPTWFKFFHENSAGSSKPEEYESLCGSSEINFGKETIRGNFYGKIVTVRFSSDASTLTMTVPCSMLKSAAHTYPFGKTGNYTLVFRS